MPLNERDAPPVIPSSFKIYDSYTVDPEWQRTFTWIWLSVAGASIAATLPSLVQACRSRRLFTGYFISETINRRSIAELRPKSSQVAPRKISKSRRALARVTTAYQTVALATLSYPQQLGSKADCCRRAYLPLSAGQVILVLGYIGAVIGCLVKDSELATNSNRAGFLALANLTPLLLLTLKNNPLALLLGLSYPKLNYLHRWAGRMTFVLATVHGGIWWKVMPSARTSAKGLRGIASWVLLLALALSSARPIRKRFYQLFFTLHLMCFAGFFAAVSYHTPYARPWIFPPLALYAADLALRLCRYRIKDAILVPLDGMTMIHIPDCDYGWLPTQHISIRILTGKGIFESHSFTITNATSTRGITLYAKAVGNWTRSLHAMASTADEAAESLLEKTGAGKQVKVMIDGPYGGLHTELSQVQEVLVIAGGSGITFALGTVEEALRTQGPSKVTVAWVCRDIATIKDLTPALSHLSDIATARDITLIYDLYLTKPPSPLPLLEDLPTPTTLQPYRPTVSQLVREHLPPPSLRELEDGGEPRNCCGHGGLAVVACGPEGIVSEARNAVARLHVGERVRCGGVSFHGEAYSL